MYIELTKYNSSCYERVWFASCGHLQKKEKQQLLKNENVIYIYIYKNTVTKVGKINVLGTCFILIYHNTV